MNVMRMGIISVGIYPSLTLRELLQSKVLLKALSVKNLSQSSAHTVHQKTQTKDKFCVYNGFTNAFYQKLDPTTHQRTHKEKFYQCDKYEKSSHQNSPLSVHQQCAIGEKSLEPIECGKSFYQKAHLIQHQRTHSGEKPSECQKCGKSFCSNSHPIHYSRTHMGISLYKCNEYGKTFTDNSILRAHQRIHTGEKPYECSEYKKTFPHNSNFRVLQEGGPPSRGQGQALF